jgi:HK97 family phage major capsid protein
MGVLTAATLGYTNSSTSTIAYADLIELEHSVDPEYRKNASFMCNDSTLKAFRKLVDSGGRPLFIANGRGTAGETVGGTLDGWPVTINPAMPNIGAGAKPLLFGDFSKYKIRRVRDVMLMRLTERYSDSQQVGFNAVLRADGNLMDAGTHPIKFLQNASS